MGSENKSSFTAFLDGYREDNLEANSGVLSVHIGQIDFYVSELRGKVFSSEMKDSDKKIIFVRMDRFQAISRKIISMNFYEYAVGLSAVLDSFYSDFANKWLLTDISGTLKSLIYNFLVLSKVLEENNVIQLAMDTANKFSPIIIKKNNENENKAN